MMPYLPGRLQGKMVGMVEAVEMAFMDGSPASGDE
jgi:hypothetical protein